MSIIKDNVNYGVEVKIIREGGVDVQPLEVTENGTYTAEEGTAYSPVVVNVQGGGGDDELIRLLIEGKTETAQNLDLSRYSFESVRENGLSLHNNILRIILPSTCTRLDTKAFANNYDLVEVTMDNVEYMGYGVFEECWNMRNIVLPSTLKTCDTSTFNNSSFESITFPSGFENGTYCFNGAHKLNNIKFLSLQAPQFDDFEWAWEAVGDEASGEHTMIVPVDGVGYDTDEFPPYKYLVIQKGWNFVRE